jgi:hypothetical protein
LGIEGGMMVFREGLLIGAVAAFVLSPAALPPEAAVAQSYAARQAQPAKAKKRPSKRLWRGYGFLPGYRPPPDNLDPRKPGARKVRYEQRYWRDGQLLYGWGYPGYFRGRWNGGSFGPCWTSTPIGMMPTCGQ